METEYKYTFNNLKTELKAFNMQQLEKKLEEQQKELMKRTTELMGGSTRRINYTQGNHFNLKKIHRIIAVINTMIRQQQND